MAADPRRIWAEAFREARVPPRTWVGDSRAAPVPPRTWVEASKAAAVPRRIWAVPVRVHRRAVVADVHSRRAGLKDGAKAV